MGFQSFDKDNNGTISHDEMQRFVELALPGIIASNAQLRARLVEFVTRAGVDADNGLDFFRFLCVLRHFHDLIGKDKMLKEMNAVSVTSRSRLFARFLLLLMKLVVTLYLLTKSRT